MHISSFPCLHFPFPIYPFLLLVPLKPRHSLRQFVCDVCKGRDPRYKRIWWDRVTDDDPYSPCRGGCGKKVKAIEVGKEIGVGACKFECPCGNEYTVICEMTDTARCYECDRKDNLPVEFKPPRKIEKKTSNTHSCSKCNGRKNCPNLRHLGF